MLCMESTNSSIGNEKPANSYSPVHLRVNLRSATHSLARGVTGCRCQSVMAVKRDWKAKSWIRLARRFPSCGLSRHPARVSELNLCQEKARASDIHSTRSHSTPDSSARLPHQPTISHVLNDYLIIFLYSREQPRARSRVLTG